MPFQTYTVDALLAPISLKRGEDVSCLHRHCSGKLKAQIVLESFRGQKTLKELAVKYGVADSTISVWRREIHKSLPMLFDEYMVKYRKTRRELKLERELLRVKMYVKYMEMRIKYLRSLRRTKDGSLAQK